MKIHISKIKLTSELSEEFFGEAFGKREAIPAIFSDIFFMDAEIFKKDSSKSGFWVTGSSVSASRLNT